MTRMAAAAAILAAVLVLSACGNDGGEDEDATTTPDDVMVIVTLTPVPSATVRSEMVSYVVAEGDTLLGIAMEFGVSQEEIQRINDLPNPNAIFVGQTLSIPAPTEATPEAEGQ